LFMQQDCDRRELFLTCLRPVWLCNGQRAKEELTGLDLDLATTHDGVAGE
jgi:hypothetical protein